MNKRDYKNLSKVFESYGIGADWSRKMLHDLVLMDVDDVLNGDGIFTNEMDKVAQNEDVSVTEGLGDEEELPENTDILESEEFLEKLNKAVFDEVSFYYENLCMLLRQIEINNARLNRLEETAGIDKSDPKDMANTSVLGFLRKGLFGKDDSED